MQAGKYFPINTVVVVCPVKHCMWEYNWSFSWKFSHSQEKSNIFCHIQNKNYKIASYLILACSYVCIKLCESCWTDFHEFQYWGFVVIWMNEWKVLLKWIHNGQLAVFEHEVSATQVVEKNEMHLISNVLSVSLNVWYDWNLNIQQLVHCVHIS